MNTGILSLPEGQYRAAEGISKSLLDWIAPPRTPAHYKAKVSGLITDEQTPAMRLGSMIHRAILGSVERFIGILIEHYGGRFPDWLAPTQAVVLPVADRHNDAARAVVEELKGRGVRARLDDRSESVGRKIRDAELSKAPYMLVLGDREAESGEPSVRSHADGELGAMSAAALAERIGAGS
jgi:threonyl-tRNA synthetase